MNYNEEIKKAIDSFEEEDYISCDQNLRQIFREKKNEYLMSKLGLEKDVDISNNKK